MRQACEQFKEALEEQEYGFAEQQEQMIKELERLDLLNQEMEMKIEERDQLLDVLKDKETLYETKIGECESLVQSMTKQSEALKEQVEHGKQEIA